MSAPSDVVFRKRLESQASDHALREPRRGVWLGPVEVALYRGRQAALSETMFEPEPQAAHIVWTR